MRLFQHRTSLDLALDHRQGPVLRVIEDLGWCRNYVDIIVVIDHRQQGAEAAIVHQGAVELSLIIYQVTQAGRSGDGHIDDCRVI